MVHVLSRRCAAALAVCLWAAVVGAQDLDRVLYSDETVLHALVDPMEDPEEKGAFEDMRAAADPATKRRLAERFLQRFPKSWMTSSAHQAAAQASIELNDLDAALAHGRASLRILPENSPLQVSMANVMVHAGLLGEAEASSRAALDYLQRFRHPLAHSSAEWEQIARQLGASAEYVIGRVLATRGLRSSGERRAQLLASSRERLLESARLNPADGIALLLLGIVQQELGDKDGSVRAFASAARQTGPARERALQRLREIWRSGPAGTGSFEGFLSAIPRLRHGGRAMRGRAGTRGVAAPYAGSDACADCHAEVSEAWAETGMAKMFRPYKPENIIGDFSEDADRSGDSGPATWRAVVDGGVHYLEMPTPSGPKRYRVDYTIGSKWQQAYATRLPDGRIHVFPLQYNRLHGEWVNFWAVLDGGPSDRSSVGDFHRMRKETNYQVHCSSCHTSQVLAEGALVLAERITFREAGVNCEMCHGPSQPHVEAMREGRPDAQAGGLPVRFGEVGHERYVAVCAQCHMQSAIVDLGSRGEINYPDARGEFPGSRLQRPYEDYSRGAFYKDGRFRETTFIVESFVRSQCYREGQAHCGHCHDPHPADSASNPTSLKFRENRDQMCLQCHGGIVAGLEDHTRHAPESAASRCAACHMPKIMNSMMFQAGTHRIDDIPDAAMTERFGPEESPNACLACHDEETPAWAVQLLADW